MFVEIHILQNFAPSNLNRDETGTPKSCEFGGYRRARVSSQALKRAARNYVKDHKLLDELELGRSSKRFKAKLIETLQEKKDGKDGMKAELAIAAADLATRSLKVKQDNKGLTKYLLFIGNAELNKMVELCQDPEHIKALEAYSDWLAKQKPKKEVQKESEDANQQKEDEKESGEVNQQSDEENEGTKLESDEDDKKSKMPKALQTTVKQTEEAFRDVLDLKSAADIAMFGRMIADLQIKNVNAASQVAHAISTHDVHKVEFDYYTALDDLQPKEEPGAGQIGVTEFNSACYYRYANIHIEQLMNTNLNENKLLAERAVRAFLNAFVIAVPSGKQNSFATPTPPSFVMFVVREHGLCSLANAFTKPARPSDEHDVSLIEDSIQKLIKHYNKLEAFYGGTVGTNLALAWTEMPEFITLPEKKNGKVDETSPTQQSEAQNKQPKKHEPVAIAMVDSLESLIEQTITEAFSNSLSEGELKP